MSDRREYWVVTTGRGMLPAGTKVGHIEARNEEAARKALAPQVLDVAWFGLVPKE